MVKTILLSVVKTQKDVLHGWGNASEVCLLSPKDPRITGMKGATHTSHLQPHCTIYLCHYTMLMEEHALTKSKKKWKIQHEIFKFFNSFLFSYESFSLRYRYTSNTIFSPGVLKIRKMSVNWGEYNNQETITNLEERPVIENIYVGPDSQVYRVWQIKHGRKYDDHCKVFCRVPAQRWL